jgi:UDP-glucuronate 4-epimerase
MSESILVTGGSGFIGSHLVDNLLDEGHRVTALDNFNDFYDPAIKRENCRAHGDYDTYRLIEGDIRDVAAIETCFSEGELGEVIHLAAMAGVRPSIINPTLYQEVNLIGTMNLLEACRRYSVDRFIFASSSSVYGNNEKVPFSEEDRVDNPISPYASTKKSGELMVYTYHHLFGIKAACLRLFTVYGPRQRPEMAIHLFTDSIHHDREILRFGDGSTRRDYTYVDDIVAGIQGCRNAEFDYEIINLGRSDTVSLSDLIAKLEKRLDKKARVTVKPDQAGDVRQTYADIAKAKRLLDFTPRISIDQGLDEFVTWYLKQQRNRL